MYKYSSKDMEKYLVIGMATRQGFAHVPTFYSVCYAAMKLGRIPVFFCSGKGKPEDGSNGYNIGRNDVMEQIRNNFPGLKTVRMFWLDDDNIIMNPDEVMEVLQTAIKNYWNVTFKYHSIAGEKIINNVWRRTPENAEAAGNKYGKNWTSMTDEQIESLAKEQGTDYPVIDGAGLGSCYIELPTDYKFHFDEAQGEDFHLWDDEYLGKRELRCAYKPKTGHWKSFPI